MNAEEPREQLAHVAHDDVRVLAEETRHPFDLRAHDRSATRSTTAGEPMIGREHDRTTDGAGERVDVPADPIHLEHAGGGGATVVHRVGPR